MSYVRAGEDDSDVYVIPTSAGVECCGCSGPLDTGGLIAHLRQHEVDGLVVPGQVYERLEKDREINDRVASGGAQVTEREWLDGWGRPGF